MLVHVYLFLLVVFLLCLALLRRLCWLHHQPSHSPGGAMHSRAHRLLKPRSPDDCPTGRLASTASSGGEPASAPVRPGARSKAAQVLPNE